MSRDKLAKLESSGKPIEAEVSSASQMVLACDMSNDQLVARVSAGFQKIASEIPYIIELRARFQRLPRGNANIAGCRTWKEFCEVVLKRSDRRIRQVLADNDSEALAKIDSKTKHELRGVKIDPPLPRSNANDIEAAVHDVMTTTAPISLNDAAKKHHVQMEEVKRGICKGGKEWLAELKETQLTQTATPASRIVVDPLRSVTIVQEEAPKPSPIIAVTAKKDPPADKAENEPPADRGERIPPAVRANPPASKPEAGPSQEVRELAFSEVRKLGNGLRVFLSCFESEGINKSLGLATVDPKEIREQLKDSETEIFARFKNWTEKLLAS